MANTTFRSIVRYGVDTGVPATTNIGRMEVTQTVTIAANTSGAVNVVFPACDITDWTLMVNHPASAGASAATGGILVRLGNVTDEDYFGQIKASAAGIYKMGAFTLQAITDASVLSHFGVADGTRLSIDVTAVSTAAEVAGFAARLFVTYFPR